MNIIAPAFHNDKLTFAVTQQFEGEKFYVFNELTEAALLTGFYDRMCQFMAIELPEMRENLLKFLEGKDEVQIFLGTEIGTLYAAYYTHLAGVRFSLTIRDLQVVGGISNWVKTHRLTMNRLLSIVFEHAEDIEINGEHHLEKIKDAFPRIPRTWHAITIPGFEVADVAVSERIAELA